MYRKILILQEKFLFEGYITANKSDKRGFTSVDDSFIVNLWDS